MLASIQGFLAGLSLLKMLVGGITSLAALIGAWWTKRQLDQKKAAGQSAVDATHKAEEITDDEKRIEAKADAACKLEKLGNPDSDCG